MGARANYKRFCTVRVSNKNKDKACMAEMMSVIECLQKFNKDQSMCSGEIKRFDQCFVKFRASQAAAKAEKGKGKIPVGQKLTPIEMNKYMKKFPQSMRTKQDYLHPD